MITAYAKDGFRLNNGMRVFGSMAILPCGLFSWNVASPKELTEQSLALFSILNPKPEMVIVGEWDFMCACVLADQQGNSIQHCFTPYAGVGDDTSGVDYKPLLSLKSKGINVNIMSTEHAISTYNYLCCENRMVAAALIPPTKMRNLNLEDSYERNKHFKADDVFGEDRFGGKGGGNTWLT